MRRPFELDWLGGASERFFHKKRSVDPFPWGTLDPAAFPEPLLEHARASWTEGAWNEYTTAAAFSALLLALLEAGAPVDLVGMAGEFVADEMLHVELNARIAMELGGAAPLSVDFEQLLPRLDPALTAQQRANELIVQVCCVGEAFSVPILTATWQAAGHPLTRAVLERIVRDEAPHARLGWLYLDWAREAGLLDPDESERLARVAAGVIAEALPDWEALTSRVVDGRTSEGYALSDVNALGWMDSESYARVARTALAEKVTAPLRRAGIPV